MIPDLLPVQIELELAEPGYIGHGAFHIAG